jgi:hypothetical protein
MDGALGGCNMILNFFRILKSLIEEW